MNKLGVVLVAMLMYAGIGFAQNQTIDVDISKLSQTELINYQNLLKASQEQAKSFNIDTVSSSQLSKYAETGKALGEAFNSCWGTISTDVEKFAQSDAGKLTMFLVAWKIMGEDCIEVVNDFIHYTFGGIAYIVFISIWVYMYRRCTQSRYKIESTTGWWLWKKNTYSKNVEGEPFIKSHDIDESAFHFLAWIILAVLIGIASMITFS
jgi:hypothetical protein